MKVLILGSTDHSKYVDSYAWHEVPRSLNLADYDRVIMSFVPFIDKDYLRRLDESYIPEFDKFARLLFSNQSEIVVIGSPSFILKPGKLNIESWWWLPLRPQFNYEEGNTKTVINHEFDYYLDYVDQWSFCLRAGEWSDYQFTRNYLTEAGFGAVSGQGIWELVTPLATNRYDRPISFAVRFRVKLATGADSPDSSSVFWLPATTKITDHEAIDLILRQRYGIKAELNEPIWLERFPLPQELEIKGAIEQLQGKVRILEQELDNTYELLRGQTKFHKLLFETGEDILEPIVREALGILGGKVTPPKVKGKDDGRVIDPKDRQYTLEIKGHNQSLRLEDVRQIHQWVSDIRDEEDLETKGLLIANLDITNPPGNRVNLFPDNCVRTARNRNIVLVSTTQIYYALIQQQEGNFSQDAFWDKIYNEVGVSTLPDLVAINPDGKE